MLEGDLHNLLFPALLTGSLGPSGGCGPAVGRRGYLVGSPPVLLPDLVDFLPVAHAVAFGAFLIGVVLFLTAVVGDPRLPVVRGSGDIVAAGLDIDLPADGAYLLGDGSGSPAAALLDGLRRIPAVSRGFLLRRRLPGAVAHVPADSAVGDQGFRLLMGTGLRTGDDSGDGSHGVGDPQPFFSGMRRRIPRGYHHIDGGYGTGLRHVICQIDLSSSPRHPGGEGLRFLWKIGTGDGDGHRLEILIRNGNPGSVAVGAACDIGISRNGDLRPCDVRSRQKFSASEKLSGNLQALTVLEQVLPGCPVNGRDSGRGENQHPGQ